MSRIGKNEGLKEAVGRLKVLHILAKWKGLATGGLGTIGISPIVGLIPPIILQKSTAKRIATCRFSLFSKVQSVKGLLLHQGIFVPSIIKKKQQHVLSVF